MPRLGWFSLSHHLGSLACFLRWASTGAHVLSPLDPLGSRWLLVPHDCYRENAMLEQAGQCTITGESERDREREKCFVSWVIHTWAWEGPGTFTKSTRHKITNLLSMLSQACTESAIQPVHFLPGLDSQTSRIATWAPIAHVCTSPLWSTCINYPVSF